MLKLFKRNSESAEITELRECVAQNDADRAWSESFWRRIALAETEVQLAVENLTREPSDARVEGLVSARRALREAQLFDGASVATTEGIGRRIFERTIPVLRRALSVTRDRLVEEAERLLEIHRQQATELGLSADGLNAGGMVGALRGEIATADNFIARIGEKAAPSALRSMIEFCLSKSAS